MKSKQLHAVGAVQASPTRPTTRWRVTALALAAALVLGAAPGDADALALGRVTVLSALGEPLRAEIDVPQISPDEAASLRATLASPEAFRAAGLEYSPLLTGVQISLQRRANGSQMLLLSGDRPVTEPFVDILVEANWANGRIVRDLTMLFDPPQLRAPAQIAAQVPQAVAAAAVPRAVADAPSPASAPLAASGRARSGPASESRATASAPRQAGQPAAAPGVGPGEKLTVKSGDSAGRIAAANKPATVSLDQMLVALLRSNPDAFMDGNINRLKAGAVLDLPSAEQAGAISRDEARQTLVAQSRDFNEFRRRLADGVGSTPQADAAGRGASGRLQAQVEEKSAAPATPDRLTLSKGAVAAQKAAAEERLARERSTRDAETRVAELNKNIAELNRVASGAAAAGAAASAPAEAGPAIAAGTPAAGSASPASAPDAAVSAAAPTATPSASAAGPVATAGVGATAAGVVRTLLENPLLPAAGAGLLALLMGFGWYRIRQGRKAAQVDSSFLESRLQPDSFFGASGGQRIDTAESSAAGSSMVYSPSQLDAAGDVDPVAEADVYLAYGRDLQAEEILKEAMRVSPQRVAIHGKLLEIYARRRDLKAFDLVAADANTLTEGIGHEWEHIAAMGRELAPTNPMYQSGGWRAGTTTPTAGGAAAAMAAASAVAAQPPAVRPQNDAVDIDLDFSLGSDTVASPLSPQAVDTPGFVDTHSSRTMPIRLEPAAVQVAKAPAPVRAVAQPPAPASVLPELDLSFDDEPTPPAPASAPTSLAQAVKVDLPDLNLASNAIDFDLPEPTTRAAPVAPVVPVAPATAPVAAKSDKSAPDSLMDFDLDSLSFDLDGPASQAPADAHADADAMSRALPELTGDDGGDPLATKLALAEEFSAIGDAEGARSLAQEVLAEASGELRQRAQRLLADIG